MASDLPHLNLEQLRIFQCLATAGSVSGAARNLCVTGPAVSYGIRRLEERLGVRLFRSEGRCNVLTEEGKILLQTTRAMFSELAAGQARLDAYRSVQSGTVRFGVPEMLMHRLMQPVLQEFHADHPDVGIEVKAENHFNRLLDDLRKGLTEFMLVTLPDGYSPGEEFEVTELGRFSYSFAASRSLFPELQHPNVLLEEIAACPLITLNQGHIAREALHRAFEGKGIAFQPPFECESMSLIEDFTRAGLGLGFVITGCVESLPEDEDVFVLRMDRPLVEGSLVLVRLKGRGLSLASKVFLSVLEAFRSSRSDSGT